MVNGSKIPGNQESPLYIQIQNSLKEMIEGSEYAPGDQIPSERELVDRLRVSRMTVRRAIESLIDEGLLERRSTSGTYVREPQVIRDISPNTIQSLTRQIQGKGGQAGSRLLLFEKQIATKKISKYLNLRLGENVYCIRRLRLTSELPFCIETSYLPVAQFPNLTKDKLSSDASLYQLLAATYLVRASRSLDRLDLSYATAEEAQLLDLRINDPVIFLRSVIFDEQEVPFEYVKSINHPFRVAFQVVTQVSGQPRIRT